jgi:outer membrane protein assembly factor BamB
VRSQAELGNEGFQRRVRDYTVLALSLQGEIMTMLTAKTSFGPALALAAALGAAGASALGSGGQTPAPKVAAETDAVRGDPERTGYVPGARLPQRPVVLWTYRDDTHTSVGQPAAADGVVYFGDRAGTVHARRDVDGRVVWQNRDPERGRVRHAPQIVVRRIYVNTLRGVEALDERGTTVWRFDWKGPESAAPPLVAGGRVFTATGDGTLFALDADRGIQLWRQSRVPAEKSEQRKVPLTASTDGQIVFVPVVGPESCVEGLDAKTGRRLWTFAAKYPLGPPPVQADRVLAADLRLPPAGAVVAGIVPPAGQALVYALDRTNGQVAWEFRDRSALPHGVATRPDAAFVAVDLHVVRLDLATGKKAWEQVLPAGPDDRWITSAPLVTDDSVVVSTGGHLCCLAADTGALRWRAELPGGVRTFGALCTDGRRLYVRMPGPSGVGGTIVAVGEAP